MQNKRKRSKKIQLPAFVDKEGAMQYMLNRELALDGLKHESTRQRYLAEIAAARAVCETLPHRQRRVPEGGI